MHCSIFLVWAWTNVSVAKRQRKCSSTPKSAWSTLEAQRSMTNITRIWWVHVIIVLLKSFWVFSLICAVLLTTGCGWSFPCDMWSIGCILVEFCTGDALFQTHDNLEHMAMMEPICGKLGTRMMKLANKATQQKLFKDHKLDYPNSETTKQSRKYVKAMRPLKVSSPVSDLSWHSGYDPSGHGK